MSQVVADIPTFFPFLQSPRCRPFQLMCSVDSNADPGIKKMAVSTVGGDTGMRRVCHSGLHLLQPPL